MLNTYPHTNMQDMNLDWLLQICKESKEILDSVHDEIEKYFTTWINENYAKLLLNAFYVEDDEQIIFSTSMKNLDVHTYNGTDTMTINQLI